LTRDIAHASEAPTISDICDFKSPISRSRWTCGWIGWRIISTSMAATIETKVTVFLSQRAKTRTALSLMIFGTVLSDMVMAGDDAPHWTYKGDTGPEHWAELSPDYVTCGIGVHQSPVDIVNTIAAKLDPLVFDYQSRGTEIVNNGHTLQVNAEPGSELRVGGEIFELLQIHVHSPSEHRINGEAFPLEAHFVHQDAQGSLAVVAVLFRSGAWNEYLAKIGNEAPEVGRSATIDLDFRTLPIYHDHLSYYRYSGSLTTPPCTEGVRWFVLKAVTTASPAQAATFVSFIGEDARGPQPINARVIIEH